MYRLARPKPKTVTSLASLWTTTTTTTARPPRTISTTRDLPLQGITVVSLEQAIAAPYCTRQLADLGARVIKVERPDGGDFARHYDRRVRGQSSHFVWANRSKESLALDLKRPRDRAVLATLLGRADVLVQNLAPGATARLGLSYEHLRRLHPRLILCDISGYGGTTTVDEEGSQGTQGDPSISIYQNRKAYDLLVQAEAGVLSITGTPTEPAKVGLSIADIAAATSAVTSILGALLTRQRTGQGAHIDISMLESMAEWMGFPLYYTYQGQPPPPRVGAQHATIYPYGPFATGDGGSVLLGLQNEREWARLCREVLQQPALVAHPDFHSNVVRVENRRALARILDGVFAQWTAAELRARLDAAGIANAKVNSMDDVWQHPQLQARRRWTEVRTEGGWVPALLPPGCATVDDARMDSVPLLGEHTEAILAELGIAPDTTHT